MTRKERTPSLLPLGRGLRTGTLVLVGGLVAAAWLAALLALQPSFSERAGPEALPHLSVDPLPFQGVVWGEGTTGPGWAFADGEALLLKTSLLLMLLTAAAAGLGQMAVAGVVAVARRSELRLRRALGAPRDRIVGDLVREAGAGLLRGTVPGTVAALIGAWLVTALWTLHPALPTPALAPGWEAFAWVTAAVLCWAAFSFVVVQSGEAVPGAPLHPAAPLGEPFRGEVCHPGVPILQIAVTTLILVTAGLLGLGSGTASDRPDGSGPLLDRMVIEAPPGTGGEVVAGLLERASALRSSRSEGRTAVTSAGFWEGAGHVRYAETECGYCFWPGNPPTLAPLKGEPAVHHAVSPDTFDLAGIMLIQGRGFTPDDGPGAEPVAVVSHGFARENFQDGDAVGRKVRIGADRNLWHTVVGVIEPLPRGSVASRRNPPEDVLVPVAQLPPDHLEVVTTGPDPLAAAGFDPGFRTLEKAPLAARAAAVGAWTTGFGRFWLAAGAAAGGLALLGTLLTVGRRVREEAPEIALRRALGATRARLAARYLGLGLRIGIVGALLGAWLALFAVSALFPEGFAAPMKVAMLLVPVAALVTGTAGLVSAVTAWMAMRGPPRAGMEG